MIKVNIPNNSGSAGAAWGDITGTLSNQADLNQALTDLAAADTLKIPYAQNDITKDPTGFTGDAIITYNSTTRKITITGTFVAYWRGHIVSALVSGWESAAHADVADNYFLRYDGTNFVFDNSATDFFNQLQISIVQYQSAYKIALRECHQLMDWRSHYNAHINIGTAKLSGGDFSSYTLNSTTVAQRRPDIAETTLLDEDLQTINPALTSKLYTQRYLSSTNTKNYTLDASEILSVTGAVPNYNQWDGSAWIQTAFPTNAYGAVFVASVPVTSDSNSQKYRYIFVQPQTISTTLATIRALTPSNLTHGDSNLLLAEYNFIGKIIVRYVSNNWTLISVESITGTKFSQTSSQGQFLSAVATTTPISGDGTSLAPIDISINDLTQKTVLADNDLILIEDSADSYNPKKALKSALAGGGLTNFTESNYLYSSKTGVKLLATNAATNVDIVLQPKGLGGILAQQPDGTVAGGNNRGNNAVDLQTKRVASARVASGDYSFLGGGSNNASLNNYAFIGTGNFNYAAGLYAFVGTGSSNVADDQCAFVGTGSSNYANEQYSFIGTGCNLKTSLCTQGVVSGYNTTANKIRQASQLTMQTTTTNTTETEMFLDNASARAVLKNNQKWGFIVNIVASQNASVNYAYFTKRGIIRRGANAADTVISAIDTIGTDFNILGGGSVAITADTTNGSLKIAVTGVSTNTIYWQAKIELVELEN